MPDIQRIDFHGHHISTCRDEETGKVYCVPREIASQIGTSWSGQYIKLTKSLLYQKHTRRLDISTPGGMQEVLLLDIDYLPTWLTGISPEKVSDSVRDVLITYQEECTKVLRDYWFAGIAVNPRTASPPLALPTAHDRLDVLKACTIALEALGVFDDRDRIEFGAYVRQVARSEMQPLLGPGTPGPAPTPALWTLSMRLHALGYPPLHGPESTSMQIKLGSAAKKAYMQTYDEAPKKMWDYVKGQMREVNAYPAERVGVLDETIASYLGSDNQHGE